MRKRFKIPLYGMVAIVAIIAVGIFVLIRSHYLEKLVNRLLAERIASQYNLDITIGEIQGSFVGGFVLNDVNVRFGQNPDTITLAYFPSISINYQASNLWHKRWIIDSLRFDRPQLFLQRDTTKHWRLPVVKGGSKGGGEAPTWEVRRLMIDSAAFQLGLGEKTIKWYDVNLASSMKSEQGTLTLAVDSLRFNSSDGRLRVNRASGLATYSDRNLVLQNVAIATDSSRLALSFLLQAQDTLQAEAVIDSARIHLPDVVSFLGLALVGDLDLAGSVWRREGTTGGDLLARGMFMDRKFDSLNISFHYDQGIIYVDSLYGKVLDGCGIEGYGDMNLGSHPEGYRLVARMESFNLNNLVFNSFSSDLSGRMALSGRGLNSQSMALDFDLNLDESFFDIYHFHSAVGQMTVTTDGLYFFPGFEGYYHDNRFVFDGGLDYTGEMDITGRAELPQLADFVHQTFIDLPGGRGTADFGLTGPTADPNLSGEFRSDSVWLNGFFSSAFDARFDIASFIYSRRGTVDVAAWNGDAWSYPYDSIWAGMRIDSNLLYIDSAYVGNKFSRDWGRGVLDYLAYPQMLNLDSVDLELNPGRQFASDGAQRLRIDSNGFIFDRVQIRTADGRIGIVGRADYDESLALTWEIDNMAVAPWVAMLKDSLDISGSLSSTGRIEGRIDNPVFSMQTGIDSLRYQSLLFGNAKAYVTYRDSTLQIDSCILLSPGGRHTISGEFPINLAFHSGHEFFDQREQMIHFHGRDSRLDLVAFFLPTVEYITGDFEAELDLTGQPRKPHLNGVATLKNGVLKLVDLRDRFEPVEVELTAADELVTVTRAEAVVPYKKGKEPGKVSAAGTVRVNDINNLTYDLALNCTGLPVNYEMGDFAGTADANLRVTGVTPPKVTGTIEMPYASYRENFAAAETGFSLLTALEGDKTWDLDLMWECPSGFWVKNSDIDAEFSGNVNILRTAGTYNYLGSLEVIRGKYFLFDKVFMITPGGQITFDNIEEPDPKLALDVSTRIRSQSRYSDFESQGNYTYDLDLQITGTLNNPIISGTSGNVSTEEILPAILTNYRPSDIDSLGTSPVAQRITIGGVGMLASQVSRFGTRGLGVETFEIDPGIGKGFDPLATRLTIGTYTLPNLYVFGSSTFNLQQGQEVGAEFRLGRHYVFEGRR
ncbi:MAG: translocation/assembly module TamB domain-containing protein, partial [candidate division Zixibacteria bacterium]|nr:translocation/assembly module TamB domain-containing protein [candidate division Zixibacteria bacterium]